MHREVVEQEIKLIRLFKQAKQLQNHDDIDDETKSGFVSYLCVRTSVYVESSVKTILREYVRSKTSDLPTNNFVNANLRNLTPRRDQIISLVRQFDHGWSENLKKRTEDFGDSLNAIVVHRNEIAHGEDVDISLHDLEQHFRHAREVVELVYNECNLTTTEDTDD